MSNKNEVFEYLIDQLRQQVNSRQCEDLAHEVQSLKNQLRDASAQIKELTLALDSSDNEVMCLRSIVDINPKGAIGYIRRANSAMTGTMRRQYLSKALEELGCKDTPEQSGCRKEDTHECYHNWRFVNGKAPAVCINCGATKSSECEHEWRVATFYGARVSPTYCRKCGLKK
mgnify:CR=1 FL=1